MDIRVALFTETFLPKLDGIVTAIRLTLEHFQKRQVPSLLIAPRMTPGDITRYADTPIVRVSGLRFPLYPELRVCWPGKEVRRAIEDFGPTVIHVLEPVMLGLGGLMMARGMGIPTIASFHIDFMQAAQHYGLGFVSGFGWALHRAIYNRATYTLGTSMAVVKQMRRHGIRNVGLWRRGVDSDRFSPQKRSPMWRERLTDGHPDRVILLYVGRVANEKCLHHLHPVVTKTPGVHLAIVGNGPAMSSLRKLFSGTPTTFVGYLRGEELSAAYASADIFVFPSALETFGLVVTEAMASGLPVVSSRVGGVPDVVIEGESGFTFEPGDVDTLLESVRKLATSPELRRQMGKRGRELAEKLSWPTMMDELLGYYTEVAAGRIPESVTPISVTGYERG